MTQNRSRNTYNQETVPLTERINTGAALIGVFITTLAYTAGITWWASSINTEINSMKSIQNQILIKQDKFNEQLASILLTQNNRLTKIETKLEITDKTNLTIQNSNNQNSGSWFN